AVFNGGNSSCKLDVTNTRVEQWISRDLARPVKLRERRVLSLPTYNNGCLSVTEVITSFEAEWHSRQVATELYCRTVKTPYALQLIHWEHDPNKDSLRQILVRMADAFRLL